jgi:predicted aspartyl protease
MGASGREAIVEGILDIGFDGILCLPISLADSLGLELIDVIHTELADGTSC